MRTGKTSVACTFTFLIDYTVTRTCRFVAELTVCTFPVTATGAAVAERTLCVSTYNIIASSVVQTRILCGLNTSVDLGTEINSLSPFESMGALTPV